MTNGQATGTLGRRSHPRYAAQWKIVVVYKHNDKHETYRGKIVDISLGGTTLFASNHIYSEKPVIATIEIPPYRHFKNSTIVGVRCTILHSIHSSTFGKYRIGLKFISFNGKGESDLKEVLSGLIELHVLQNPYT